MTSFQKYLRNTKTLKKAETGQIPFGTVANLRPTKTAQREKGAIFASFLGAILFCVPQKP